MRNFTLIKYTGEDAGEVLCTILSGNKPNIHEIETHTQIGSMPNPEDQDEEGDVNDDE